MAILVAGKLQIRAGSREAFLDQSVNAVIEARQCPACRDFSVSADLIDQNRVNIFEKWDSKAALDAFRASGSTAEYFELVERFDVTEYEVE